MNEANNQLVMNFQDNYYFETFSNLVDFETLLPSFKINDDEKGILKMAIWDMLSHIYHHDEILEKPYSKFIHEIINKTLSFETHDNQINTPIYNQNKQIFIYIGFL